MKSCKLYINGEYVCSSSNEYIDVENPSNGEIFARVPAGGREDVDKAVCAAKE